MTNFTKGPWQVSPDGSIGSIETINDGIAIGQAMQVHPLREDMSQSERRANAILMAAAPELLHLLIESQENIGGDWRERRDAAIKKATGAA